MGASLRRLLRPWVPVPFVGYSMYLVVLYSSGFWTTMVGTTELILSVLLLSVGALSCVAAVPAFEASFPRHRSLTQSLFHSLTWLSYSLCFALAFLTRDVKKRQIITWIDSFVRTWQNSFLVDAFRRTYPTDRDRSSFANLRTAGVHDGCICALAVSLLLYVVFFVDRSAGSARRRRIRTKPRTSETLMSEASVEERHYSSIEA
jgi:hypothetical protein